MKGRLVRWDDDRGFGFVSRDDGDDVFVHVSEFPKGPRRPVDGDELIFDVATDDRRGPRATNVAFARNQIDWSNPVSLSATTGLGYFVVMGLYAFLHGINVFVPVAYAIVSLLTYMIFARDKYLAQTNQWRTSEQTLFTFSLFGGWPGALFAQWNLRHKNRKSAFQVTFWIVVILNVAITTYFFMPRWGVPIAEFFLPRN